MTTSSRQAESSANAALADLLRGMMHGVLARAENTQVITGNPALRPDVLITDPFRAPVVVEAEYLPAPSVEDEARSRLALGVEGDSRPIEAAVALRYPTGLQNAPDIRAALLSARSEYAVHYKDGGRFPTSGWLTGSIADLADLIRLISIPQSEVDAAADALERGIERAAVILDELDATSPAVTIKIAQTLGMVNVPQTRRMACAILANALIFQERIAAIHPGVKRPRQVCGNGVTNPQEQTRQAWDAIVKINYYPIFAIGMDILDQIDPHGAARILNNLEYTANEVNALGVATSHDLTGRIFQRLIADRKYLATFYTLPASAALLAQLAVAKLDGVDWADSAAIGNLRVADFACGTGALLSAVYEQIANRHERAGGNADNLHAAMIEDVLYGCDVMPSAIHISGATLSGIRPNIPYANSRLYTMPYGRQQDGEVKLGSLELLQTSSVLTLFNTSDPAMRTGSVGEQTASQITAEFPDESYDLVIMNPPFTRNVTREGETAEAVAAAFAAFDATDDEQRAMARRMHTLKQGTCYHGNAGIASAFAGLADKKLRNGGVLALVLPLSAASGGAWQAFRKMMAANYTDLTVLSIAANGKDMSFSSDTGMAELLIIGRKRAKREPAGDRAKFISLTGRPQGIAHSSVVGNTALNSANSSEIHAIEDGPFGGMLLSVGDDEVGEIVTDAIALDGGNYGAVRIKDYSLAQTAHALAQSQLWLPASPAPAALKTAPLGAMAKRGLYHLDIIGRSPRGPFTKTRPSPTSTYPALWNHSAKNETRLICEPDSQLRVKAGMQEKSAAAWATASRSHLNLNFTFGSQPLAVAFTERETIGGSVWPNVIFGDERFDYAFAIWGNCSLGLLSWWYHSSRQQSSKAGITITAAESLPTLDLRALTDAQLATAHTIFNEFRPLEFLPACLADADPNRALLDRRVLCDLLAFPEPVYRAARLLAQKWCAEPSVHGGKRRPNDAEFVV